MRILSVLSAAALFVTAEPVAAQPVAAEPVAGQPVAAPVAVAAEPIVLKAVTDFKRVKGGKGSAKSYVHKGEKALAVNAAKFKGKFASARTTFKGPSGVYDLTVVALLETDGESSYKLSVDGKPVGKAKQNRESDKDYVPYRHTWKNVSLSAGDAIEVAFNSHTNGKIPEGDTTAYSRGRWTQLVLSPAGSSQTLPDEIDDELDDKSGGDNDDAAEDEAAEDVAGGH